MPVADLAVEYVSITSVKGYRNNARTHSKQQLRKIAASIRSLVYEPSAC
jgi:hypothetical protein